MRNEKKGPPPWEQIRPLEDEAVERLAEECSVGQLRDYRDRMVGLAREVVPQMADEFDEGERAKKRAYDERLRKAEEEALRVPPPRFAKDAEVAALYDQRQRELRRLRDVPYVRREMTEKDWKNEGRKVLVRLRAKTLGLHGDVYKRHRGLLFRVVSGSMSYLAKREPDLTAKEVVGAVAVKYSRDLIGRAITRRARREREEVRVRRREQSEARARERAAARASRRGRPGRRSR